ASVLIRMLLLSGILQLVGSVQAGRPVPPAAPSSLTASAISSSQIKLTWLDNSKSESGFIIQRSTLASRPWSQTATTRANLISYTNNGLAASTTYFYRICAYNSRGSSSYSATASATTLPALSASS